MSYSLVTSAHRKQAFLMLNGFEPSLSIWNRLHPVAPACAPTVGQCAIPRGALTLQSKHKRKQHFPNSFSCYWHAESFVNLLKTSRYRIRFVTRDASRIGARSCFFFFDIKAQSFIFDIKVPVPYPFSFLRFKRSQYRIRFVTRDASRIGAGSFIFDIVVILIYIQGFS